MIDYSQQKISEQELIRIFEDNNARSIFINDYDFFGLDENDSFYLQFINENISNKKSKLQEDAIELSIAADIFNETYFNIIRKVVFSRRTYWIKLLCLDWLNVFADRIPKSDFLKINERAAKENNDLLRLQANINILSLFYEAGIIENIIDLLCQTRNSAVFYRFINHLNTFDIKTLLSEEQLKRILTIVNKSALLSVGQKNELITKL